MKVTFPWLQSPAIQQLLNKLVDKLDAADARGSAGTLGLSLNEKTWPALYEAVMESDKEDLWDRVLELHKAKWLQITPPQAIKSSQGYASNPKAKVLNSEEVRTAVGRLERSTTANERWRAAIQTHLQASDEVKQLASNFCIELADHDMSEVVQQLNNLAALRDEALMVREVSAKLFWGMSKVLDNRIGLINAILETQECPFAESPVQLQVFLPKGGFQSVLFVENQVSYERAIRSSSEAFFRHALVFASGFKGSASRLRNAATASVYISTLGETKKDSLEYFQSWLFGRNTSVNAYFWGDLDWSGLRILSALRQTFPGLEAWKAGYQPMVEALLSGEGHSPEAADKSGQQSLTATGCSYSDEYLIPAIAFTGRFLDQELFLHS